MKKCTKCGEIKELSEFNKQKATKDGLRFECRSCQKLNQSTPQYKLALKQYHKQYNQTPKYKLYQKQRQQTPERKFYDYQKSAQRRNYPFDLSLDQFTHITNQPCKYCGANGPNGVDRIDNSIGYILENLAPCCAVCNHVKWDLSAKQMYSHILKMIKHSFKNWHFSRLES